MTNLWTSVKVGDSVLNNRLVMAPMTRSRALDSGVPGPLAAEYYAQRATMGLIITEGTQPSAQGQGYPATPGIYTAEQVDGWRKVIDAVHDQGGKIFIQLMHVGRIAHPDNLPNHEQAVAPSAIAPGEEIFTKQGMQEIPEPRELTKSEIDQTVNDYRHAAAMAIEAGADGVEIHGANGYLIHQFLGANSNQRADEYGGSIANRIRFAIEVTQAVVEEIGPERTGFRISPLNLLGGVNEGEQAAELYHVLVSQLNDFHLAYLHMMHVGHEDILNQVRADWDGPLMVNRANRPLEKLTVDLDNHVADLVSVGNYALANPDLVARLKNKISLNKPNPETIYVNNGAVGYTDYPTAD